MTTGTGLSERLRGYADGMRAHGIVRHGYNGSEITPDDYREAADLIDDLVGALELCRDGLVVTHLYQEASPIIKQIDAALAKAKP